jgi:hypothetical protein
MDSEKGDESFKTIVRGENRRVKLAECTTNNTSFEA